MSAQDWTILLLFVAGFGLFWLEMFLPGGLVGIAGFVALVAGIALTYQVHGPAAGTLCSVTILVLSVLLVRHWMKNFPRSYFGSRMTNRVASGRNEYTEETRSLAGSRGVALSRLQPGGKGLFGDRQLDVVSQLGSIESGTPIEIIRVEGIVLFVRPCDASVQD